MVIFCAGDLFKNPGQKCSGLADYDVQLFILIAVSTSVITALTIRSESSFNEPHPDRDSKRVNKHRAIPIPLIFLSSNCLILLSFYCGTYPIYEKDTSSALCVRRDNAQTAYI